MQLIGYMDSPFVRRVAVTAEFLGIPYEHRELSIFRDFEEFSAISPLVKVPTLVCDSGEVLVESTLIIDYLESLAGADKTLLPQVGEDRIRALQIIGIALVANEKVAQIIYEIKQRPVELQHPPWIERLEQQLRGAIELLHAAVGDGDAWFFESGISQADITAAITWRFIQRIVADKISADDYPGLVEFSARAEALTEFSACPLS
ncbi:MAG: glutathione S-transferase [Gammaproteobacteria bacterium]|nr:MAG: glutathione S-transferase [Gammaproteobacteria bacterium]RLA34621.1 MAG: glutathione S-transferase [Gammaproteobacteria bacterium]